MTTMTENTLDLTNPKPGMYRGIPSPIYHSLDAASKSRLGHLWKKSPAHCKDAIDHPKPSTPAMKKGSAQHASLLEPEVFAEQYVVAPDFGDCRKTENKKRRDEWAIANAGKIQIESDVAESIRGMTAALKNSKTAYSLICQAGYSEASFIWTDPDTDALMKCRTDRYLLSGKVIDIKTCADASEWGFARQAASLLYDLQAAIYLEGVGLVTGETGLEFYFIAVESESPYAVQVYKAERSMLNEGRRKYRKLIEQYAECHNTGIWPAYPDEVQALELPAWAMSEDEVEITLGGSAIL